MARRTLLKPGIILCGLLAIFFINIQQKNKLSEEKVSQDRQQAFALQQQRKETDRKFVADQKDVCLMIYRETSKWNNATGWRYDANSDTCYLQYRENPKKTEAQCEENYKGDDEKVLPQLIWDWLLCKEGLFEKLL